MNPLPNSVSRQENYSALALRRRSVWEAADSGVLLWRSSFAFFIPFFAVPVWIAACGLRLLPNDLRYLSYLALWWLKPLFDRLVLHVVSLRFFDSSGSQKFKDLRRGLLGTVFRGLLGDLLWRRFSPGRGANMPVRVLEKLRVKQYRQRKKILASGGLNFCFLISALGLVLEAILLFGEIVFTMIIAEIFFPSALAYMRDNMEAMEVFVFIAFTFNYLLVESLYLCMGFGLYINSRVEVEGWDLQLLFRNLAGRRTVSKEPPAAAKAALLLCLFLILAPSVHSDPGEDEEPATSVETVDVETVEPVEVVEPVEFFPEFFPLANDEALLNLEEILASSDFGSEKEGWGIKLKESLESRETPDIDFAPWVEKIRYIFSFILRLLIVLAIAGFAGFAFYRFRKMHRTWLYRKGKPGGGGKSYVNPLLVPESPESLFAMAEDLFRDGSSREAWAACLAGCLGKFARDFSLSFPADATEYGCLDLVAMALPGENEKFGSLVHNWVLLAYGGRIPAEGSFEEALAYGRSLGVRAA